MNRDVDQSPATPIGRAESIRRVAERGAERIREWFRLRGGSKFDTALSGFQRTGRDAWCQGNRQQEPEPCGVASSCAVSGECTGRDARRQRNRQQEPEPGGAASSCAVSGERTGRDARRQTNRQQEPEPCGVASTCAVSGECAFLQFHPEGQPVPMNSPGHIQPGMVTRGLCTPTVVSEGLEQALSILVGDFSPLGSARLRVFVAGQPAALPPSIQEQLYLIGREALLNAVRHSEATSIEAEIEYRPRCLSVVVRDNGCGIDPNMLRLGKDEHRGLMGMRRRAESLGAQLRIWSRPGAGTEVEISVPCRIEACACA